MNQLRTADRGDNPCEQRDQAGQRNREESDGRIDRHVEIDWVDPRRKLSQDEAATRGCERDSKSRTDAGDNQTLGQEPSDQPPPTSGLYSLK